MTSDWKQKGYIKPAGVDLPSEDRLSDKPVAVIECPQEIPCDPCKEACPVGAIQMEDLNAVPRVNSKKCTGCSICVQECPGLAVFMLAHNGDWGEITIPYEFLPLPKQKERVDALDRKGERICEGEVIKVLAKEKSTGGTPLITVRVPKKYINEVRNVRK